MNFTRKGLLSCVGLLASLCMTSTSADAVLASVKTTGMAQTGISYPQDALAAAFNPAGAAWVGNRFDLGASYAHEKELRTL